MFASMIKSEVHLNKNSQVKKILAELDKGYICTKYPKILKLLQSVQFQITGQNLSIIVSILIICIHWVVKSIIILWFIRH